jgi:hypothetical protein
MRYEFELSHQNEACKALKSKVILEHLHTVLNVVYAVAHAAAYAGRWPEDRLTFGVSVQGDFGPSPLEIVSVVGESAPIVDDKYGAGDTLTLKFSHDSDLAVQSTILQIGYKNISSWRTYT